MLEPAFPGRDVLLDQIEDTLCRPIDENGSLDLQCESTTKAPVEMRVPIDGEAVDRDGITIHYLLHVVAGMINELEVFKEDSSKVLQHPDPEKIEVMVLG